MQNHKIEPQDIALDAFRALFRAPIAKAVVSADGKTMRLGQNLSDRLAAELYLQALYVIDQNRLPLEVEVKEWKAGQVVFDRFLVVTYIKTVHLCR